MFFELGIRATTSEVASRAGIAEGTIFRYLEKEQNPMPSGATHSAIIDPE